MTLKAGDHMLLPTHNGSLEWVHGKWVRSLSAVMQQSCTWPDSMLKGLTFVALDEHPILNPFFAGSIRVLIPEMGLWQQV